MPIDDYAGTASTTGYLTIGGSSSGQIETNGDRDWFAVSLTAGTTYTFRENAAAGSGLDAYLRLMNASGTQLASNDDAGSNYDSLFTYTPTSSGTFYLVAGGYGSSTGTYTVAASGSTPIPPPTSGDDYADTASTTGHLTIGGSSSGQIETNGDRDWFAVSLTAGTTYTFRENAAAGSGLDAYLRLMNASGTQLASNDDAGSNYDSLFTYTPTSSGTFYLAAGGYGSSTGAYTVAVSESTPIPPPTSGDDYADTASTTGHLTIGGLSSGQIETNGDRDWFAVSLTAGTTYTFRENAAAGSALDAYLRLMNAGGTQLASNDDAGGNGNSLVTYTPTSSGIYFISAGGYGSTTGAYTVAVSGSTPTPPPTNGDDYADTASTTGHLTIGGSSSGQIETNGDRDWFAVSLTAGTTYTFRENAAAGSSLDSYLRLMNASGTQLASNDDAGGNGNSLFTYTPTSSGIYYVAAGGYGSTTGAYTVAASGSTPPPPTSADDYAATSATTGHFAAHGSTGGVIETAGDADWFAVTLTVGQRYTFNLDPAASNPLSDPYLSLFDSLGRLITSNDDDGPGYASEISFSPTTSATYYLGAQGFSTSTGAYVLTSRSVIVPEPGGGGTGEFDIVINFSGDSSYQIYFDQAAALWESVILSDMPDVRTLDSIIDDLVINASIETIDGRGNILGQAGPTAIRPEGVPYSGIMRFDVADIASMVENGTFGRVVVHEMAHILGFSNLFFDSFDLVNPNDAFQYTGSAALAAYRSLPGADPSATSIPIENDGGPGTAGSHWDEAIFGSELMTGYISGEMELSIMTIGVLQDLGYQVNFGSADPYSV